MHKIIIMLIYVTFSQKFCVGVGLGVGDWIGDGGLGEWGFQR